MVWIVELVSALFTVSYIRNCGIIEYGTVTHKLLNMFGLWITDGVDRNTKFVNVPPNNNKLLQYLKGPSHQIRNA